VLRGGTDKPITTKGQPIDTMPVVHQPAEIQSLDTPGGTGTVFNLEDEAIVYARPILVIMGDTHTFRIDKPILGARSGRVLENILRLEVPGDTNAHWVRVKVDPAKRGLFSFEYEDVVENYVQQQRP